MHIKSQLPRKLFYHCDGLDCLERNKPAPDRETNEVVKKG